VVPEILTGEEIRRRSKPVREFPGLFLSNPVEARHRSAGLPTRSSIAPSECTLSFFILCSAFEGFIYY
uniref:Uncharacterized protein n=1 Tax=Oryctolagus cuniculus TaxID=9986 RepID=A0A5F9D6Y0_RABIT